MNNPLKAITNLATQSGAAFPANSRYHQVETAGLETEGRPPIIYLRRRIVPQADRFDLLFEYTVVEGDRLDNLAAKHAGDPELFWRIADANDAIAPEDLTKTAGRRIRITLPEGIPGQAQGGIAF
jgi:hypothetical protein